MPELSERYHFLNNSQLLPSCEPFMTWGRLNGAMFSLNKLLLDSYLPTMTQGWNGVSHQEVVRKHLMSLYDERQWDSGGPCMGGCGNWQGTHTDIPTRLPPSALVLEKVLLHAWTDCFINSRSCWHCTNPFCSRFSLLPFSVPIPLSILYYPSVFPSLSVFSTTLQCSHPSQCSLLPFSVPIPLSFLYYPSVFPSLSVFSTTLQCSHPSRYSLLPFSVPIPLSILYYPSVFPSLSVFSTTLQCSHPSQYSLLLFL